MLVVTVGFLGVVASGLTVVGSDALWLPAMGAHILENRAVPVGIPWAAAPSAGWVNTTVLGQIILAIAYSAGSVGVAGAQVLAGTATLAALAVEANGRGASPAKTILIIIAVAVGGAAPLLIARAQLLSLVPFALLLALVRRQQDRPSSAIWWAVPLIALWGNLHGAVLVGVAALGCYLLFSRMRINPLTSAAVGVAALAATCLNPGLANAPRYYAGVFSGGATSDASGMWGPLTPSNPFDVLLVIAATALVAFALRHRQAPWEYVAAVGLLAATFIAARNGIWLLLFLVVPAASTTSKRPSRETRPRCSSMSLSVTAAVAFLVGAAAVLAVRNASFQKADVESAHIADATRGHVVLAAEPLAESLAAAGATLWVSNPLDAFSAADQSSYLAFMNGNPKDSRRALEEADMVVARPGTLQARVAVAAGYRQIAMVGAYAVMRRA